jgi:[ribosomal protein S18]-alanine N-acetyltransferase
MELANQPLKMRQAAPADAPLIARLLRETTYQHVHPDWRLPVDLLDDPGFLLLYSGDEAQPQEQTLWAALAVTADPPPAAWVRFAAVHLSRPPGDLLALLWEGLLPRFAAAGIIQVGWFAVERWADLCLPRFGFAVAGQVETYQRKDAALPDCDYPADVEIRSMTADDLAAVVALDEAAFEPLWRYSAATFERGWRTSFSFDLAVNNGRIIGFQLSERYDHTAHLSRMAVHPDWQGRGVGRLLLRCALESYRTRGLQTATLNTQADNWPSKRLYHKFGFELASPPFAVWSANVG